MNESISTNFASWCCKIHTSPEAGQIMQQSTFIPIQPFSSTYQVGTHFAKPALPAISNCSRNDPYLNTQPLVFDKHKLATKHIRTSQQSFRETDSFSNYFRNLKIGRLVSSSFVQVERYEYVLKIFAGRTVRMNKKNKMFWSSRSV